MYFVIEHGDTETIKSYETRDKILNALSNRSKIPNFLNLSSPIPMCISEWKDSDVLVIKGDIVIPKPVQVIQKYEIE